MQSKLILVNCKSSALSTVAFYQFGMKHFVKGVAVLKTFNLESLLGFRDLMLEFIQRIETSDSLIVSLIVSTSINLNNGLQWTGEKRRRCHRRNCGQP